MEREQEHRHSQQNELLSQRREEIVHVGRAQRYTFAISMTGIVGSCVVATMGYAAALAVALASLAPLIRSVWPRKDKDPSEPQ